MVFQGILTLTLIKKQPRKHEQCLLFISSTDSFVRLSSKLYYPHSRTTASSVKRVMIVLCFVYFTH